MTVAVFAAVVTAGKMTYIQSSLLPVGPFARLPTHPVCSTYKIEARPADSDARGAETSVAFFYFKNNNLYKK